MDSLPITPVRPDPFPAVRTERIAKARSDRDREPASQRGPQRRRPQPAPSGPDADPDAPPPPGSVISVDA